ncbi:MAG: hypothetical protein QCI38_07430 [Candidatus Thermoplasmatota archaeon]|nr:hypothetical protein [Candidatus Thermoplasmatota archaeon]
MTGPPDMRNLVESNRGLVKKIELAIPGFRGYRKREDLRVADSLLRQYLSDRISRATNGVAEIKAKLSKNLELELVKGVGEVENSIHILDKRLRHAEQGYSGVAPDYKILESELHTLYNYDYQMLGMIEALERAISDMQDKVFSGDMSSVEPGLGIITKIARDMASVLDNRRNALAAAAGGR